jgi:hypothetical protein
MGRVLRNGQVVQEGFYENGKLVRESKVKLPNIVNNSSVRKLIINQEIANVLTQDVKKENDKLGRSYEANLAENKFKIEVKKIASPDDGSVIFEIQTNLDTASLKINGEEEGGSTNGKYLIKKFARAGQITEFKIEAISVSGKTALHTESVDRPLPAQKHNYAKLNPSLAKKSVKRDAVAIVIGISAYKNFPKAEYANADAKEFVEYAIRVLGVTDIRLLIDEEAEIEEIYKTFKTWLPPRVKSSTDLYIFYSGHGMPSPDGKNLFWLPQRASRELISKTALSVEEIIQDIKETKPKSVTMFIDACYSGLARNGETLIKDARPVSIKSNDYTYPDNFVVFSASMADQISSSSPELQHGVFSYYLMKGMEGEADITKDGKITFGELQEYLSEKISRHASTMGRKQNPQLIGDKEKIFVLK